MHRQVLDVGVRLGQLELAGSSGEEKHVATGDLSNLENRLTTVESSLADAMQKVEDASKANEKGTKKNVASVEELQRQLTLFVKYVGGETGADEEGNGSDSPSKAVAGEWALAWLERRVAALAKEKPLTIDARLRKLEKENPNSPDMVDRLRKLENDFHAVDMKDLCTVRPDLLDYQQHQELVDTDIMKEVNELKCIVGCIEACIPRETRKAVQLFKRAAGSSEATLSPREFNVESKILQLREDMQNKIQDAADSLHKGREDMTAVVKGLERKHDLLEARLESARFPTQVPFASPDTARSNSDDRTRLHSAATNASRETPPARISEFPEPSVVDA